MNPYEVLGVSPDATQDEIAKAYRAKSRKLHPDAGGDAAAFAELSHAYEILSDEANREQWERLRSEKYYTRRSKSRPVEKVDREFQKQTGKDVWEE